VHRFEAQGFQDQQVQRALDDIGVGIGHRSTLRSLILIVKMWTST
jgi:hypothetical protein